MKIGCIASHKNNKSTELLEFLITKHPEIVVIEGGVVSIEEADLDVIIALGGDGFILRVLHKVIKYKKQISVYGVNCGNLGFLLNSYNRKDDILEKINKAIKVSLSPLKVIMEDRTGRNHILHAINEISLIRQTYQAVNIRISIDSEVKLKHLIGDGVMLATGTGSAAYNLSAGGVIVPLESHLLTITAINPFRPRGWHRAILTDNKVVEFDVLEDIQRPVLACADFHQLYFIKKVKAMIDKETTYTLLFDHDSQLGDKIMDEQFLHN